MEYLESQLRQKLASVVWTHKIQEKEADYYKRLYSIRKNWSPYNRKYKSIRSDINEALRIQIMWIHKNEWLQSIYSK